MTDISGDGQLKTFEDVVQLLGGTTRVAALTQRSRSSVWNWRQTGQFPPAYYRVIRDACAARGSYPDMRLFAFADDIVAA